MEDRQKDGWANCLMSPLKNKVWLLMSCPVSIDFLSQMTWLWPASSGSSSRSTKSGTDMGLAFPPLLTCWVPAQGQGLCHARGWGSYPCILLRPAPCPGHHFLWLNMLTFGPRQSSFCALRNWILLKGGSDNVCIKVQGEFGEEKQRTLCYTGPINPITE